MDAEAQVLEKLFQSVHTIAIVGLSEKPHRASYGVAQYMQAHGFEIIGVNPTLAGRTVLGIMCYASLEEAKLALAQEGRQIDVVDCFRKSTDIPAIADAAIQIGAPYLWLQLDIDHPVAVQKARAAGMTVVVDRCIKIEHRKWLVEKKGEQ